MLKNIALTKDCVFSVWVYNCGLIFKAVVYWLSMWQKLCYMQSQKNLSPYLKGFHLEIISIQRVAISDS